MKVLWLTNKVINAVSDAAGIKTNNVNEGWINHVLSRITEDPNIELIILCGGGQYNLLKGKSAAFEWYIYKETYKDELCCRSELKDIFKEILNDTQPDIIHIWGSEYPHSLALMNAALSLNMQDRVVLWIQGLISACSLPYYYQAGLPMAAVRTKTLYDRIMKTDVLSQNEMFLIRGDYEMQLISKLRNCIGRTEWDRLYVKSVNPNIRYFKCNETLREEFYSGQWDYKHCQKFSIFFSQASYPLKGFHLLIEAVAKIIKRYPDLVIYVGGADIMSCSSLKDKIKLKGYGKYLRSLARANGLYDKIHFTGKLNSVEMKKLYLKSNVFVCASSLENSSNSVGEAMLLGVPTVVSRVGGTGSIINYGDETFSFCSLDVNELATKINDIFELKDKVCDVSQKAKIHALKTHDPEKNYNDLIKIYQSILECNDECN